jgi:hypothetical protein
MTNRKCHILSKNRMSKGPDLIILYQSVGPVHHAPLRYWVQIPRYLPVSSGREGLARTTTLAVFQGWEPVVRQQLKRATKISGCAENTHLRNLYEMPESPGAEALEVSARHPAISSAEIGMWGREGRGGGVTGLDSTDGKGGRGEEAVAKCD